MPSVPIPHGIFIRHKYNHRSLTIKWINLGQSAWDEFDRAFGVVVCYNLWCIMVKENKGIIATTLLDYFSLITGLLASLISIFIRILVKIYMVFTDDNHIFYLLYKTNCMCITSKSMKDLMFPTVCLDSKTIEKEK